MFGQNFTGMPNFELAIGRLIGIYGALIAFALIIAIITAIVASRKGRNGFGWFFMGLFLNLLGLGLILIALPKKYYVDEEDEF